MHPIAVALPGRFGKLICGQLLRQQRGKKPAGKSLEPARHRQNKFLTIRLPKLCSNRVTKKFLINAKRALQELLLTSRDASIECPIPDGLLATYRFLGNPDAVARAPIRLPSKIIKDNNQIHNIKKWL
jgi:hypothetical protein